MFSTPGKATREGSGPVLLGSPTIVIAPLNLLPTVPSCPAGGRHCATVRWWSFCFISGPPGLQGPAQEASFAQSEQRAWFRRNECTGRAGPEWEPAHALSVWVHVGRAGVGAELGFIFVLIPVRECIASIYLDDLSGKRGKKLLTTLKMILKKSSWAFSSSFDGVPEVPRKELQPPGSAWGVGPSSARYWP